MEILVDAFSLKTIIPSKIFSELTKGLYENVDISSLTMSFPKYKKTKSRVVIKKNESSFKTIVTNNGAVIETCTTNNDLFDNCDDINNIKVNPETPCIWCRRKFKDVTKTYKDGYNIPCCIPQNIVRVNKKFIVDILTPACTFNCALAELFSMEKRFPSDKNIKEYIQILHLLFTKLHPGKQLVCSKDYRL